jgi:hypothetical protein
MRHPTKTFKLFLKMTIVYSIALLIGNEFTKCQVRADFTYNGTISSLEWLVDASYAIALAEVITDEEGQVTFRIDSFLKKTSQFPAEEGEEVSYERGRHPRDQITLRLRPREDISLLGGEAVLYFHQESTEDFYAIYPSYPDRTWEGTSYLTLDMFGKIVIERDDLLERIKARIEEDRNTTPNSEVRVEDAGFAYWPSNCGIETGESYYYVFVPPELCFEERLQRIAEDGWEGTQHNSKMWAKSILYRCYPLKNEKELEAVRKEAIQGVLDSAARLSRPKPIYFDYISYLNHPDKFYVGVSWEGEFVCVLENGSLELYRTEDRKRIYQSNDAYENDVNEFHSMIFSPQNEFFAHLASDGDVCVVELEKPDNIHRFDFPWETQRNSYPCEFTFSRESCHIALNMSSGSAGTGHAILLWDRESGELITSYSDKWSEETECQIVGFGPHERSFRYDTCVYYNIEDRQETSFIHTGWITPNTPDEMYWGSETQPIARNSEGTRIVCQLGYSGEPYLMRHGGSSDAPSAIPIPEQFGIPSDIMFLKNDLFLVSWGKEGEAPTLFTCDFDGNWLEFKPPNRDSDG